MKSDDCTNGHWTCDANGQRVCKSNWLGSGCNAKTISPVVDSECPNNILSNGGCYNGGTCFNKGCCCAPGFTGKLTSMKKLPLLILIKIKISDPYCKTQIDNCIGNACANNATCVNGINSYTCLCPTGYTGQFCHISLNPCKDNPCTNGVCKLAADSNTGYYCSCFAGWTGQTCNTILNNW